MGTDTNGNSYTITTQGFYMVQNNGGIVVEVEEVSGSGSGSDGGGMWKAQGGSLLSDMSADYFSTSPAGYLQDIEMNIEVEVEGQMQTLTIWDPAGNMPNGHSVTTADGTTQFDTGKKYVIADDNGTYKLYVVEYEGGSDGGGGGPNLNESGSYQLNE